ncbi:hypothetical protein NIES21_02800 [Anabaenopsis circularis NIES-21]|uniref:Uncharacterized protein n=2 Tax=Nostocales TaxID=1161 RepID=A0A1Z4GAG9_9CYAN|nr:DUF6464 family protein [Nostoc cycadae]BAY14523.1 hypothetical protein NIES21_02800 [Anabaenopsis circularis NIES-21]GBE92214.1 hypothetical protein NCWK1_1968 [Nostoc cycadae WK-1]
MGRVSDFVLMAFCTTVWYLLGIVSAIATPQMQVREPNQSRKTKNFLPKNDCLFNARSPYIQCAVNPTEVCDQCIYFVEYEEWEYN